MKKTLIFILFVVLMMPIANAFFDANLITGQAVFNEAPEVTPGHPSNNLVTHKMYFTWKYEDHEDDEQEAYLIQIGEGLKFSNVIDIYGLGESSREVRLKFDSGEYCWRIKVKDAYAWGEWSERRCFTLDASKKTCSDGTAFWECSKSIPLYCDGGNLVEDCQRCGCNINEACRPSGICVKKTCRDGTSYGRCGIEKPYYCQAGDLVEVCSLCGCPSGKTCQSGGTCSVGVIIIDEGKKEAPRTLLEIIAEFFKGLFKRMPL